MTAAPVSHPVIPVLAERGGTQLQTPRPTLLVDSREQNPFNFSRFKGWFAGIEKKALPLGDYSVAGLEDICVVERKDLSDLVHSCTVDRKAFIERLRLMARYPHRLLVVTSTLSQVKSPFAHASVDPNRTTQFLVAVLAGLQVRLQRDARARRGTRGVVFVSGSPLPLVGIQRPRPFSVR
jgi:ERCC4-type nuclease